MHATCEGMQLPSGLAPDSLGALIHKIRAYLGTDSGIDSADTNVDVLKEFMADYQPNQEDWRQFSNLTDPSKGYCRFLVDGVNRKSNLLFLVWNPGQGSPVHNHADSHCVMKIVHGSLNETVYNTPDHRDTTSPMQVKSSTDYAAGETTYISDEIGLHAVTNNGHDDIAVSIHLYTPPNAADYGYKIFDPRTGRCSHVAGALSTKIGVKI